METDTKTQRQQEVSRALEDAATFYVDPFWTFPNYRHGRFYGCLEYATQGRQPLYASCMESLHAVAQPHMLNGRTPPSFNHQWTMIQAISDDLILEVAELFRLASLKPLLMKQDWWTFSPEDRFED